MFYIRYIRLFFPGDIPGAQQMDAKDDPMGVGCGTP